MIWKSFFVFRFDFCSFAGFGVGYGSVLIGGWIKKHMPLTRRSSRIKGHALFLIIWQNAEKDDGKKGKHGQKRS